MTKKRGRPRKEPDRVEPAHFCRAVKIVSLYEQSRRERQKHAAAVGDVVETFGAKNPEGRISAATVKRVLAKFRPQNAKTVLRFEPSVLDDTERTRLQDMFRSAAQGMSELGIGVGFDVSKVKPAKKYVLRFGPRESFPRHNRKLIKE